jgi:probable rRNA maturation factor
MNRLVSFTQSAFGSMRWSAADHQLKPPLPRRNRDRQKTRAPRIEIVVASPRWKANPRAKALLRRALTAAATAVPSGQGELAVLLTDDSGIRALNRDWRGMDAATNVLSFPAAMAAIGHGVPHLLGDIAIAFETTMREARAAHKRFAHHLAHLAVHGFLHLVGYDHADEAEAEAMERLEAAILASLDVPDPYIAHTARG